MSTKKLSKGRQKIDMVKIKNESYLQVTFSKRRAGLFKKASEFCSLTGSEAAIVVFSPGDKAYSFGCPGVSEVIEKYENETSHLVNSSSTVEEVHHRANIIRVNNEFEALQAQLDDAKKRSDKLAEIVEATSKRYWWQVPINELNIEQLECLKFAYDELDKKVQLRAIVAGLFTDSISFDNQNASGFGRANGLQSDKFFNNDE
ncbi:OLC1v1025172C1 [Oldenlandia corymbosa var. corymbosa]|uniref:OLC1v1025172C1 n=1 Tax=Oldenlandia corymbosa var. corymbosa TaxID=529605 RepID=A0AAV1C5J3_OLDCO|nr:OLC1v1025172C1 [Oldenlandia corymbosa var. corymbosa]